MDDSTDSESKSRNVVYYARDFADKTTFHGISRIIQSKSLKVKIFWIIVFVVAVMVFCFQTTALLLKYYQYPSKVNLRIEQFTTEFPAITVCNIRNFDFLLLYKLDLLFKNITADRINLKYWQNATDNLTLKEYLSLLSKAFLHRVNTDLISRTTIASNLEKNVIRALGVRLEELVISCMYAGNECNMSSEFSYAFNPVYYNCYTYRTNSTGELNTAYTGLENAWSAVFISGGAMAGMNKEQDAIRMIPGSYDKYNSIDGSEGIRVVIHRPNTEPHPQSEGFNVPPGYVHVYVSSP